MRDPYAQYDPYRPYETDPYARPRPEPRRAGSGIVLGLVPSVVAAALVSAVLSSNPSIALPRGTQPDPTVHPTPAGPPPAAPPSTTSPTSTPSASPTPRGPAAPRAAAPDTDNLGRSNELYAATMPAQTTCAGFRPRTGNLTDKELHGYLDGMLDCLMTIHAEPLRARGITLRRPLLKSEDDMAGSSCRSNDDHEDWSGVYCAPDTTIYYRRDVAKYSALEHQAVMTHEFAHHVQREAGIIDDAEQENGDKAANDLLTRRIELQATCMAGAMLGGTWSPLKLSKQNWSAYLTSVQAPVPKVWEDTHGTPKAQKKWTLASTGSTTAYQGCNTWVAPPGDVD